MEIKKINNEIKAKNLQISSLEKQMADSISATQAKADKSELSPSYAQLLEQLNEKNFELEVKTADNRVILDQLQNKTRECEVLQEIVTSLKEQLSQALEEKELSLSCARLENDVAGANDGKELHVDIEKKATRDVTAELLLQAHQASEIEELKQKLQELMETRTQLEARNQKLVEESAYAKGLASAAGVELKALSEEVTKLMNHNERLANELASVRNSNQRRVSNGPRAMKRESHIKRHEPVNKREVNVSYERELALEATIVEKEQREAELQKKLEESKQKEAFLENELANMWVLVAKLKKSQGSEQDDSDAKLKDP
nr:unnamed protein product [Ananas comosus var. bracteatus]